MNEMAGITHVGCSTVVRDGDRILLGLRKNCFGAGTWGLPGGHLEHRERVVQAARRELIEETGVDLPEDRFTLVSVADSGLDAGKHAVQLCFEVRYNGEEIMLAEPEKCEEWKFFDIHALPDTLFPPHRDLIENYLAGKVH